MCSSCQLGPLHRAVCAVARREVHPIGALLRACQPPAMQITCFACFLHAASCFLYADEGLTLLCVFVCVVQNKIAVNLAWLAAVVSAKVNYVKRPLAATSSKKKKSKKSSDDDSDGDSDGSKKKDKKKRKGHKRERSSSESSSSNSSTDEDSGSKKAKKHAKKKKKKEEAREKALQKAEVFADAAKEEMGKASKKNKKKKEQSSSDEEEEVSASEKEGSDAEMDLTHTGQCMQIAWLSCFLYDSHAN